MIKTQQKTIESKESIEDVVTPKKSPKKSPKGQKGMIQVVDGFYVESDVYTKLYSYQKEGVKKLYEWFNAKKGGILADDMGLDLTLITVQ